MRLFYALECRPEDRKRLQPIVDTALAGAPGGRRVRPENLHITLIFVGEVDPARAVGLHDALLEAYRSAQSDAPPVFPMLLACGKSGMFRQGRGGVLWLGVDPAPSLLRFHRLLSGILVREGLVSGVGRPLFPHITVARDVPFRHMPEEGGGNPGEQDPVLPKVMLHFEGPTLMESARDPRTGAVRYVPRCRPAEDMRWIENP